MAVLQRLHSVLSDRHSHVQRLRMRKVPGTPEYAMLDIALNDVGNYRTSVRIRAQEAARKTSSQQQDILKDVHQRLLRRYEEIQKSIDDPDAGGGLAMANLQRSSIEAQRLLLAFEDDYVQALEDFDKQFEAAHGA